MQSPSTSATPLLQRPVMRAVIAVVLLAAVGLGVFLLRDNGDGGTGGAEGARGALDDRVPEKGQPAPDFELRSDGGELVTLSDLRGQVVWLNFWATWCGPCRRELPDIQALYDEKRDQGLTVLAINLEETPEQARAFWDELDLSLPILFDSDGSVYDQYRLQGLPDSFFIDREGNLAAVHFGFLTEEQARDRLAQAGLP